MFGCHMGPLNLNQARPWSELQIEAGFPHRIPSVYSAIAVRIQHCCKAGCSVGGIHMVVASLPSLMLALMLAWQRGGNNISDHI